HLAAEERSAEQKKAGVQQPKLDFSLKEGQTLNLTIAGGGTGASTRRNRPPRPATSDDGVLPALLPPPPPPGKRK
ncbi:hypothetical protein BG015_005297, partial [Linnemannia schmuckeri]